MCAVWRGGGGGGMIVHWCRGEQVLCRTCSALLLRELTSRPAAVDLTPTPRRYMRYASEDVGLEGELE